MDIESGLYYHNGGTVNPISGCSLQRTILTPFPQALIQPLFYAGNGYYVTTFIAPNWTGRIRLKAPPIPIPTGPTRVFKNDDWIIKLTPARLDTEIEITITAGTTVWSRSTFGDVVANAAAPPEARGMIRTHTLGEFGTLVGFLGRLGTEINDYFRMARPECIQIIITVWIDGPPIPVTIVELIPIKPDGPPPGPSGTPTVPQGPCQFPGGRKYNRTPTEPEGPCKFPGLGRYNWTPGDPGGRERYTGDGL
jgi:hypothetical protein